MTTPSEIYGQIENSTIRLGLELVANLPSESLLQDLVDAPDLSPRIYVVDTRGFVYTIDNGTIGETFIDLTNQDDFISTQRSNGLRSIAFHPESFSEDQLTPGYGKIYTSYTARIESRPEDVELFIGKDADREAAWDFVIAEWQFDPETLSVDYSSKREIFRVETRSTPHGIGAIRFNADASPEDADYGNLYIPFGDMDARQDTRRSLETPNSKIFRIDPLQQSNGDPYGIPVDNPFGSNPSALPEIFATGFRNPQTVFFDNGLILSADVGGGGFEEINVLLPGGNYGWPDREGPLALDNGVGSLLPSPLPEDDLYQYPVTGYSHSATTDPRNAIAIGAVIRGNEIPALQGKVIFSNFPDGQLFVADASSFEAAVADGRVTPDEYVFPEFLNRLELGGTSTTLIDLLGGTLLGPGDLRADARFGTDAAGNLYVFGKHTGGLYRFVSSEDASVFFTFNIVDTDTDEIDVRLEDNATVETGTLAAFRGVVATLDGVAGSVLIEMFDSNGELVGRSIDNTAPFSLFGDVGNGDFIHPNTPVAAGRYGLSATAFSLPDGEGEIVGMDTISFEIRDESSLPALDFALVDTLADVVITDLPPDSVVDPNVPFDRRAFAVGVSEGASVGSIVVELFDRDGVLLAAAIDDEAPFALFGFTPPGDFSASPFEIPDDRYTLQATAFSGPGGLGEPITSEEVTFTLQEGSFVYSLIDTRTNVAVASLFDGAVIETDVPLDTRSISVDLVGLAGNDSMTFELFDGTGSLLLMTTVNDSPYSPFGMNEDGGYQSFPFAFTPGTYLLRAVVYDSDNAQGEAMAASTLSFTLEETSILFEGSAAVDLFVGGDAAETILGNGGADELRGGDGNDSINGGSENDLLHGGDGDDTVIGAWGSDTVNGGLGNDNLRGGRDDDILNGGPGNDRLNGGLGNDILRGLEGDDVILGWDGDDTIVGGTGLDDVIGGQGADLFVLMAGVTEEDRLRVFDFNETEGDVLAFKRLVGDISALDTNNDGVIDASDDGWSVSTGDNAGNALRWDNPDAHLVLENVTAFDVESVLIWT